MPANAGRKGGKAPRKKTASRSVITSENRIPLQSIHVVNNSTADNQNNSITQSHGGVSSYISPPYSSLPLFPVPSPPPCMYNHYPNVSHRFPNSPLLHHQHAGVGYAPLQTPPLTPSDFTFCFKFGNVSVCSACRVVMLITTLGTSVSQRSGLNLHQHSFVFQKILWCN